MEVSNEDMDMFKEIGSIGSGNAATAISQLINKKITVKPLSTQIVRVEDVPEEIGGAEKMVMAIYQNIVGDLTGDAVYLHDKRAALSLVNHLTGTTKDLERNPEQDDVSAYKEMANIFTGSYLNAISSFLDVMIVPSIPHYACDMLGSLIDSILALLGQKIESVLLIKTDLVIEGEEIGGGYLLILDPESMQKMKDLIAKKFGQ